MGYTTHFLDQSGGTLSKRATSGEFVKLHEDEVARIEELFGSTIGGLEDLD